MLNFQKKYQIFFFLIIFLISCFSFYACKHESEQQIFPEQAYYLSPKEIISLAKQAKQGNGEAAFKLAMYYDFFEENEHQKAMYWFKIGANNGHIISQYNLAQTYQQDGKMKEAKYWYQKAADKGSQDAIEALKTLK